MLLIIRLKLFKSIVLKVQIKFIQAKSKLSSMLSVLSSLPDVSMAFTKIISNCSRKMLKVSK